MTEWGYRIIRLEPIQHHQNLGVKIDRQFGMQVKCVLCLWELPTPVFMGIVYSSDYESCILRLFELHIPVSSKVVHFCNYNEVIQMMMIACALMIQ